MEFLFPYEHPAATVKAALDAHGLELVLHNLPAGDWAAGDRGMACVSGREAEFRQGVALAAEYAAVLGTRRWHCMAGIRPAEVSEAQARATWVANVRHAAAEAQRLGIDLLIEPINTLDMPGYFVSRSRQAIALMDEVGADNVFLQYDIYHAQRMEGELANTMAELLPRIGHMWPTRRADTNRAPVKSITPFCSTTSTRWATPAGSVANTSLPIPDLGAPTPDWAGWRPWGSGFDPLTFDTSQTRRHT